MKKKLLFILICLCLTIGCNKKEVTQEELEMVNNKIIAYFQVNGAKDYNNYSFNYIDEENNVVVVGLFDNNKEEQQKFKQRIIDSDLIKFVKGKKLIDENDLDLKSFVRTYNILHIVESNDFNYLYLTIRQFQEEEVQTIKVKKDLCPNIEEGSNYEFTIKPKHKLEDNILSIFNNSEILEIKKTTKTGLEQIQENINE